MNQVTQIPVTPLSSLKRTPFARIESLGRTRSHVPPGNLLIRLCVAHARAYVSRAKADEVAASLWPNDPGVSDVIKAASAPAMTTVPGWAQELAQRLVIDTLEALGPASASGEIFRQGLTLTVDRHGQIAVPHLVADFSNAGFVAEGNPIPVHQLNVSNPDIMQPHKVAAIAVLTREMIESSNAEKMVGDVLVRAAGRMVDEVLFDGNPQAANRPAGLRQVATLTPSAATNDQAAFLEDIKNLANAVAPVAGNGPLIFVGSPGRALDMKVRLNYEVKDVTVLGSSAVINDLLCVVPDGIVAAIGSDPLIEVSRAATLHMESATPLPVGTASPSRSLWQTDSIGLMVRYPLTWTLRDTRAFAWTTPTGW
jgi:hypothetical protein